MRLGKGLIVVFFAVLGSLDYCSDGYVLSFPSLALAFVSASARAVACRSVWDGRDCLGCVGVSLTVRVVSSCIFGLTQRKCFSLYRCFWLRHTL